MQLFRYFILVGLAVTSLHAGIMDKTYFVTYLANYLTDFSVYTNDKPYGQGLARLPSVLAPLMLSPEAMAAGVSRSVDSKIFLCGASTSEHQCSQECTPEICSWSRFAKTHNLPQPADKPEGMNWWKHYRSYIDYAADEMKLNALRFSIEWALVQPEGPESWNISALDHYADVFIYAIKKGIAPIVCFHHYTDPVWFLDRGGFEKDENVDYFVQYCQKIYAHTMHAVAKDVQAQKAWQAIAPRTPLWATYNAPEGYAFRGYHQKQGPPADPHHSGLPVVAQVLKNVLESHVRVFYGLKQLYKKEHFADHHISSPKIGLLKNIHQLDPAKDTWKHYCASPLTRFMTGVADMIQNGSIYRFFIKGEYRVHIPFLIDIKHVNKKAAGALDFIGLNYYSNRYLYLTQTIAPTDPKLTSDNKMYYHYPEGMYRAICELHEKLVKPYQIRGKKLPLIVTENGIATKDEDKRKRFYYEYLYAIHRAVAEGKSVEGYLPWTLATNYEWPQLEDNRERDYGLCVVDKDNPARLHIKRGAGSYMQFTDKMAQLRAPSA
jgi:beta-glucosidase